jgi:Ca2+-binding RTX toxin-like protein
MKRRAILFIAAVVALITAGAAAQAVTKQCASGTTQADPCKGTAKTRTSPGNDILVGTSGADYITALSGNDRINGAGGADATDGGAGNDAYSYRDGFGADTLKDDSGTDTVNLSAATGTGGAEISLILEWRSFGYNRVFRSSTEKVDFSSATVIERAVGTSGNDHIRGGKESNTLKPGPGGLANEDVLVDWGGCSSTQCLAPVPLPASNDTYGGFKSGTSYITDYGGNADTLDLSHLPSDEAHFEFSGDTLVIYLGTVNNQVHIFNYLTSRQFRIEKLVFSDTTITGLD